VQRAITSGIGGDNIAENVEGRERYPINVRYAADFRDDLDKLRRVVIATPSMAQVPLGELAKVSFSKGPTMIRDEDAALTGYVYLDLNTRDYGGFVDKASETPPRSRLSDTAPGTAAQTRSPSPTPRNTKRKTGCQGQAGAVALALRPPAGCSLGAPHIRSKSIPYCDTVRTHPGLPFSFENKTGLPQRAVTKVTGRSGAIRRRTRADQGRCISGNTSTVPACTSGCSTYCTNM
jgi:hypothetical protein